MLDYVEVVEGVGVDVEDGGVVEWVAVSDGGYEDKSPGYGLHFSGV